MTTDNGNRPSPTLLVTLGLGLALAGFLMWPVLRFAEPLPLTIALALLALSAIIAFRPGGNARDAKPRRLWVVLLPWIAGMAALALTGARASAVLDDHDRECRVIQTAMLMNTPLPGAKDQRRPVDLFRAYGCRPQ